MYFTNFSAWKFFGFLICIIVLLQACSGADEDAGNLTTPTPTPVPSSCIQDNTTFVDNQLSLVVPWDGGQLYDKWWVGSGTEPTSTHPLWLTQTSNTSAGSVTWRCKECHGWDYKGKDGAYRQGGHYTGFKGITEAASKSAIDVFCAIADGANINEQHKLLKTTENVEGLSQNQILQLTRFITATNENGLVEADDYITSTGLARGNVTRGETVYLNHPVSCSASSCHGIDGSGSFPVGKNLGMLANDNPWEVLHKIRFGHPGSAMPAFSQDGTAYKMTSQQIKDVLSFSQGLNTGTTPPLQTCSTDSAAFVESGMASTTVAEVIEGGKLYDNWSSHLNASGSTADHPLWSDRAKVGGVYVNDRGGATSWRCKECHGWDYNGEQGAYNSNSSHFTGFSGLFTAVSKTPIEVFCAIRDGEGIDPLHKFTQALTSNQLSNSHILLMTKFILDANQMGMIDTTTYIPASGVITSGDAMAGEAVYLTDAGCGASTCHSVNGDTNAGGKSIGQLAFENPWEVLHKIRNGHAAFATPMPSFVDILSTTQVQDVLFYAQNNLPRSTVVTTTCVDEMTSRDIDGLLTYVDPWDGGQLYDQWWILSGDAPTTVHPVWLLQNAVRPQASDTWRCKECHGWDYKGAAGAYKPGSDHYTGFTGILASANKTPAEIFCAIRDGEGINADHQFNADNTGGRLTEPHILQLTKFITAGGDAGMLDSAIFVNAAGQALGDAQLGSVIYSTRAKCVNCHGDTGQTSVPAGTTLADLAIQNPWEVIHKIRFGNPGTIMPVYTEDVPSYELSNNDIKNVLTYAQTLPETVVGGTPTTPATCLTDRLDFVTANLSNTVASQGGLLYDKWWVALGYNTGPTQNNPMWINADPINTSAGAGTWRCKECHGWDYQGKDGAYGTGSPKFTGFPGIYAARTKPAIEVFCAISQGTVAYPEHKFNPQNTPLTDQAILQLTKFIMDSTNGVIDMSLYIDLVSKTPINADITLGQQAFTPCIECHDANGTSNAGNSTLGALAIDNPWEVLHKIRNGHPGSQPVMPSFVNIGLSITSMVDIVAYVQTLPVTGGQPPPMDVGDAVLVRGGKLFDDWMTTTGIAAPTTPNIIWGMQNTNNLTGAGTWRCKECHGWDYKGKDGQYGLGSQHYTGFVGVSRFINNPNAEQFVFDFIKLGEPNLAGATIHDFGTWISDADITALARFIMAGVVDTDLYISPSTGVANGDIVNGEIQYIDTSAVALANNANCSFCHEVDGLLINFGTAAAPQSLGTLARVNPWEVLHKARFGQPGSVMPSTELKGLPIGTTVDVLTFTQTLPDAIAPQLSGLAQNR